MQGVEAISPNGLKSQRILACTNCRKKKIKCDGQFPKCSVCTRNSQHCSYVLSRRRGRPSRAGKEVERNLDSLPKLLPKDDPSPKPQNTDRERAQIEPDPPNFHNDNVPSKRIKTSLQNGNGDYYDTRELGFPSNKVVDDVNSSPQFCDINFTDYQESNNYHSNNRDIFRNSSEEHIPLENDSAFKKIEIKYDNEPIQPYLSSFMEFDSSLPQRNNNTSPLSEKSAPSLYGVCEIANRFSKICYPDTVLVPLIPASIKSKVYNDPGIMLYFYYFNSQFPIIHYPSFREEYDDGTVPNYLIMAMKAISRRYSKQPSVVLSENLCSAGLDLASVATSLAEIAMQHDPTTSLMQTLLILSIYEFGLGKSTRAYDRRNSAIKIAYKLGINVLDSGKRERRHRSLITAEACRRLWWILLYSDRLFSLISNRLNIRPIIDESQFRVALPRVMIEYVNPLNLKSDPDILKNTLKMDKDFGRYVDTEVVDWFARVSPMTLIIGHILYQRQAAFRLFNLQVMNRPITELLSDSSWIGALCEYLRNLLVIDSEIRQWKTQLDDEPIHSPDSVLSMPNYHRKIQLYGLIIYFQFLALYSFERMKQNFPALSAKCTPLLWLRRTVNTSWTEIASAIESMQLLALDKYNSLSSESTGGSLQDSDWEFCAPHVTYFFYLGCKACVGFYHWSRIYKCIDSPNQSNYSKSSTNTPHSHSNANISQMFDHKKSWSDGEDPEFESRIFEISKQIDNFIDLINICKKYWSERDYVDIIEKLLVSPDLFRNVPNTIEVVILEMENKLNFKYL
ncbi:Activator of stress genes 1 [Smittium mucronatum]|uniref:Activator of stress genes 1 n=1 Tax=Smittium mucronatum TaxID=133383 RepID=A0A1R0H3I1_9FUNG|nr:Activator of stress genes 1 [Smittium mucronatum]